MDRLAGGIAARAGEGGLVTALVVDPRYRSVADDLRVTARNLRTVSTALSSGQGTLGALLVDPSVYENLTAVLEGSQRSRLLRVLIDRLGARGREAQTDRVR
jgi:phospholipid/cholesterol/gamma-HCH transport system substrate-binding protein